MTKSFAISGWLVLFFCLALTGCKPPKQPPVPGPIQPPSPPGTSLGH